MSGDRSASARAALPARALAWLASLLLLLTAAPAQSHPAPFSYLDLELQDGRLSGTVTAHAADFAHELGLAPPDRLLDRAVLQPRAAEIERLVQRRIELAADRPLAVQWTGVQALPQQAALRLSFEARDVRPGALTVRTDLFPYDRFHQTFVNLYEHGRLRQQWIFAGGAPARTYYFGTAAGVLEVVKTFVPAGVHHILVGPDHLLFLLGLLLLGGGWRTLGKIVTAFTLGHSLTLSLATLGVVSPPAWLVEPAIALSIVVVGADNLLRGNGRDLRAWAALAFGLVHGFGFASVLREFGLPREALAASLFSFNLGVELGQLAVVAAAASILALMRSRSEILGHRMATAGSYAVIAAGSFWFVQRVFFPGGLS